jgi:chromosome segregation ATPase
MQLRKNIDEGHMKLSVAEAALVHWQQRHETTSSLLQAEQQLRQRENQAAAADRQRLANEVWRWEASDTQLKAQLAAATQRCEELALGAENERSAAERRMFELNSSHSAEISQIKKALAEVQSERVNAQRDVEALQERFQQLQKDCNFEKGISLAAMESLQNNVDILQKQLQVEPSSTLSTSDTATLSFIIIITRKFRSLKTPPLPPHLACAMNTTSDATRSAVDRGLHLSNRFIPLLYVPSSFTLQGS